MTAPWRAAQKHGLFVLGVAVSIGLLILAGRNLQWERVREGLSSARLWPWLPLAVVMYLIGHVVRGLRTKLLVSRDAELSLGTATSVVVLGYAVNNILPARLGEFARAGMLTERTGLPIMQSLTVTLLERILDGWVLLLFLGLTLANLFVTGMVHEVARVAAIVFVVATAGVLFVLLAPNAFMQITSHLTSRFPERAHDQAINLAISITQGLSYLRSPANAARVISVSAVVWLCEAGLFLFLLPAFGLPLNPWWALLALTVTNLGILVPSTPGYVVVFHYFCQQALAAVGVGPEVALGYAVLVHLGFYIPITVWGVGIIVWYGLTLGSPITLARSARPLPFSLPQ